MIQKNVFYTILLNVINIIYPIITFPYVSRILGPSGVGSVTFVSTFAMFFSLIGAFGLPLYGVREIAKVKDDSWKKNRLTTELILISVLVNIIVAVSYIVLISVVPYFHDKTNFYIVSCLIVFFNGLNVEWFFQGVEKFKMIALRSAIVKMVAIALLFTMVKSKTDDFNYLILIVFSTIGNALINIFLLAKEVNFTFNNLNIKKHLKPLNFVFLYILSTSIYTMLDTIFLGLFSDDAHVGFYTAGVRLAKFSIPFITAIGLTLLPKSSKTFFEGDKDEFYKLVGYSFNYIIVLAIPISGGMFLLAKELLILFSGVAFSNGIPVMKILAGMPLIIGLGYLFGIQILVGAGKDREIFYSVFVGMIISVLLNIFLIPRFQHIGASYANIVCEICITGFYMYFVQKHFSLKKIINYKTLFSTILSIVPFYFICLFAQRNFSTDGYILAFCIPSCAITYYCIQSYLFKNEFMVQINQTISNKILQQWKRSQ